MNCERKLGSDASPNKGRFGQACHAIPIILLIPNLLVSWVGNAKEDP